MTNLDFLLTGYPWAFGDSDISPMVRIMPIPPGVQVTDPSHINAARQGLGSCRT